MNIYEHSSELEVNVFCPYDERFKCSTKVSHLGASVMDRLIVFTMWNIGDMIFEYLY